MRLCDTIAKNRITFFEKSQPVDVIMIEIVIEVAILLDIVIEIVIVTVIVIVKCQILYQSSYMIISLER